jgi:DNA-binding response OmpR family regulator
MRKDMAERALGHALLVYTVSREDAVSTARALAELGFTVTVTTNFAAAKQRVLTRPPDLLVTELRLGAFNGVHLVLAGRSVRRDLAAVVLGGAEDGKLREDAEAAGAMFLLEPLAAGDLVATVERICLAQDGSRTAPLRPGDDGTDERVRFPPNGRARDERSDDSAEPRGVIEGIDLHERLEVKRRQIEQGRRDPGWRTWGPRSDERMH